MKRYHYLGKEDEETGLHYYGARYCASWLWRFVSTDPKEIQYDFQSTYVLSANNPIGLVDVNGEGAEALNDEPVDPPKKKQYGFGGPFPLPAFSFAGYRTFFDNVKNYDAENYTSSEYLDFKDKQGNFQVKYDEPSSMQVYFSKATIKENSTMIESSVRLYHYKLKFMNPSLENPLLAFKFQGGANELSFNRTKYETIDGNPILSHFPIYYGAGLGLILTKPGVYDEYPGAKTENIFNDNPQFYQIHGIGASSHFGISPNIEFTKNEQAKFTITGYLNIGIQLHTYTTTRFKTTLNDGEVVFDQRIGIIGGGYILGGGFKFNF